MKVIGYFVPLQSDFFVQRNDTDLKDAVNVYFTNVKISKAVGDSYQIKALYVIQPIPTYKYDIKYDFFLSNYSELPVQHQWSGKGYQYLYSEYLKNYADSEDILWLGDIQENKTTNLYADNVHYTASFNKEIADSISQKLEIMIINKSTKYR